MKKQKAVIFVKKIKNRYVKDKNYHRARDHCHYTGVEGNIEVLRIAYVVLKYSVPEKIPKAFHKVYNYDYHFIIKKLGKEFKKQFTFLRKSTKKYITFIVPIEKEVIKIDKDGEEVFRNISYLSQFLDSAKFLAGSLSNLVNNLFERIHKVKCKFGLDDKKCETCEIKYKYCICSLEYSNFKDNLIEYKIFVVKNYQQMYDEMIKKQLFNTYKFFNHDNNKFILFLRKGA